MQRLQAILRFTWVEPPTGRTPRGSTSIQQAHTNITTACMIKTRNQKLQEKIYYKPLVQVITQTLTIQ